MEKVKYTDADIQYIKEINREGFYLTRDLFVEIYRATSNSRTFVAKNLGDLRDIITSHTSVYGNGRYPNQLLYGH